MDAAPPALHDPETEAAIAEVERQFAVVFQRVRRRWKDLAQCVHPQLQPAAYKILSALVSGGPAHPTQLADQLAVDKSALSRHLATLQRLGLVERDVDEHDGRVRLLAATPAAVQSVSAARAVSQAELRAELLSWPREDLEAIARMLERLSAIA